MKPHQRIDLLERTAREEARITEMGGLAVLLGCCLFVLLALIGVVRADDSVYFIDEIGRGTLWPGAR